MLYLTTTCKHGHSGWSVLAEITVLLHTLRCDFDIYICCAGDVTVGLSWDDIVQNYNGTSASQTRFGFAKSDTEQTDVLCNVYKNRQ